MTIERIGNEYRATMVYQGRELSATGVTWGAALRGCLDQLREAMCGLKR